jgi:hypothetical protein
METIDSSATLASGTNFRSVPVGTPAPLAKFAQITSDRCDREPEKFMKKHGLSRDAGIFVTQAKIQTIENRHFTVALVGSEEGRKKMLKMKV